MSIYVLDYPLANSVHRLRLPPYCSHNLQSLNWVVYRLFKSIIIVCVTNNPGRTSTVHDNTEILGHTFPKSMTQINIQFRVAGLVPVNRDVFEISLCEWDD